MTLSYSRDPFCCFTTSQDLQTFFDCHRRAFAHPGGVPMTIVHDRTKTRCPTPRHSRRDGPAAPRSGRVRQARFRQGLRLSRLPHHKTLDEGKANAALLGPPGVGKTHIAVAVAVAACRAGYSIYFTSLDDNVA